MPLSYYIQAILLLLCTLIGLSVYSKISSKYKLLLVLVIVGFIGEILSNIFSFVYESNSQVFHFLIPIQSLIFGFVYAHNNDHKKIILLMFSIISLLCVFNSSFYQELVEFPSFSLILLSFGLILISLLDFKRMLYIPTKIKLHYTPDFWFNLGTLLFFSMSFFVFGFINLGLKIGFGWQSNLILVLNIIMYSCYGLSIYLDSRNSSKNVT